MHCLPALQSCQPAVFVGWPLMAAEAGGSHAKAVSHLRTLSLSSFLVFACPSSYAASLVSHRSLALPRPLHPLPFPYPCLRLQELQESHDVKEAVTRISEMNVKPLSQRGLAVAALLRMGTEANAAVRGKVAEVLRELPSSKAVSAAVLSAAVAEFMEADAFADMKEDCPKLPSFLAEMLQGVTAVDAKLLHPEVAKAMGVSAAPAAAAAGAGEAAEEDDDELAAMLASGKKKSKKSSKKASE